MGLNLFNALNLNLKPELRYYLPIYVKLQAAKKKFVFGGFCQTQTLDTHFSTSMPESETEATIDPPFSFFLQYHLTVHCQKLH